MRRKTTNTKCKDAPPERLGRLPHPPLAVSLTGCNELDFQLEAASRVSQILRGAKKPIGPRPDWKDERAARAPCATDPGSMYRRDALSFAVQSCSALQFPGFVSLSERG